MMNRSFPIAIMTVFLLSIAISNTLACEYDAECGPNGYCNINGGCYQCNPAGEVCDQSKTCCPGICQNGACCRLRGQSCTFDFFGSGGCCQGYRCSVTGLCFQDIGASNSSSVIAHNSSAVKESGGAH